MMDFSRFIDIVSKVVKLVKELAIGEVVMYLFLKYSTEYYDTFFIPMVLMFVALALIFLVYFFSLHLLLPIFDFKIVAAAIEAIIRISYPLLILALLYSMYSIRQLSNTVDHLNNKIYQMNNSVQVNCDDIQTETIIQLSNRVSALEEKSNMTASLSPQGTLINLPRKFTIVIESKRAVNFHNVELYNGSYNSDARLHPNLLKFRLNSVFKDHYATLCNELIKTQSYCHTVGEKGTLTIEIMQGGPQLFDRIIVRNRYCVDKKIKCLERILGGQIKVFTDGVLMWKADFNTVETDYYFEIPQL